MNTENIKTSEPHKFGLNLPQRFDLRTSNKRVDLQSSSIYYTWENIRKVIILYYIIKIILNKSLYRMKY